LVIDMPIPEPPRDVVLNDPTTNHEANPVFAADYFETLRCQLLSTPVATLADSDGSWVQNVGYSIEATIMHACRRAKALEWLDEMAKTDDSMGHMNTYCARVLRSGIIATPHWESISRMVFAMFYVLPFSTRTIPAPVLSVSRSEQPLHLHMPKLVAHYGIWLQVLQRLVKNHGPAMCGRMPAVVVYPTTAQPRWGIPTLHLVATTELLRNVLMRRLFLKGAQPHAAEADAAAAATTWAASASNGSAVRQSLEKLELAVLNDIVELDWSAVYGLAIEHHRLLQVHE
ncbi:hypothetical protein GGI21_006380, partial [Coemansia aciculifera]